MFGSHFIPMVSPKTSFTHPGHSPCSNSRAPFSDFRKRDLTRTADRQEQNLKCSYAQETCRKHMAAALINTCREPTGPQGSTTTRQGGLWGSWQFWQHISTLPVTLIFPTRERFFKSNPKLLTVRLWRLCCLSTQSVIQKWHNWRDFTGLCTQ